MCSNKVVLRGGKPAAVKIEILGRRLSVQASVPTGTGMCANVDAQLSLIRVIPWFAGFLGACSSQNKWGSEKVAGFRDEAYLFVPCHSKICLVSAKTSQPLLSVLLLVGGWDTFFADANWKGVQLPQIPTNRALESYPCGAVHAGRCFQEGFSELDGFPSGGYLPFAISQF